MCRPHIILGAAVALGVSFSAQSQSSHADPKAETRTVNAKDEPTIGVRQVVAPHAPSSDVSSRSAAAAARRAVQAETAAAIQAGTLMKPGN
jgi:hypothetical protein